jgi:putative transcriptional regulator
MRRGVAGARLPALLLALFLALASGARAQQNLPANGLLLVAKPSLTDPNFARTVVLVTQTEDASTVGVILNRPSERRDEKTGEPLYFGGPVMSQVRVALFRSAQAPKAAAFHVLKDVYLTMHPDNIASLLADTAARYRLYAGFSGWRPRQLESEFVRNSWHILPADEATVFRASPDGLWEELLERALRLGPRAGR